MTSGSDDLAAVARVAGSLVIVIVLAVLAARLARRAAARGPGLGLRVVDRTGLSREASVAVVEVAGRALVLGVTAAGVRVLTELDEEALARARPAVGQEPPVRPRTPVAGVGRPTAGAVLDPRTWRQGLEAVRELTVRR